MFFRRHRSARDMLALSQEPFNEFEDIDFTDGCAESCEVFSDQLTMDDIWL